MSQISIQPLGRSQRSRPLAFLGRGLDRAAWTNHCSKFPIVMCLGRVDVHVTIPESFELLWDIASAGSQVDERFNKILDAIEAVARGES